MRRIATLAATAVALAVPFVGLSATSVHADDSDDNDGKVCQGLDSTKIDTTGDPQSVTVKAPEGLVITSYCVKAGSLSQGNGPVYVTLDKPLATLVVTHPSGKAVSHYSLAYSKVEGPPAEEPPAEEPPAEEPPAEEPPAEEPPAESTENPPAVDAHGNFDWNWKYATPSCHALTVAYPSNIPDGQSNDVNVRVHTDRGDVNLNFHNNATTWSKTHEFTYSQHAQWPAGVTEYSVVWVQVAGSNYHFGESFHNAPVESPIQCRIVDDGVAETFDAPVGLTDIQDWRTGSVTVAKGRAASADSVTVVQPGLAPLSLQKLTNGSWRTIKSLPAASAARVTFPKETRKGAFRYRVVAPATESVTGDSTAVFTVRVR